MLGYCPGPQRQQRKEAYGPTLQKGDLTNEELGQVWSDHIAENDYDARDVIAEWWHMWGRLL
ncbi:hypothetical protein VKT23_015884 [Stygiomarasmius scandens]|uniref:Uncharacterized protein n=1 Tax=Marasmiellus scandens TaxID=2682957 RepID=A0ABR1IW90_9AGAR